jgi:hypothetical protein
MNLSRLLLYVHLARVLDRFWRQQMNGKTHSITTLQNTRVLPRKHTTNHTWRAAAVCKPYSCSILDNEYTIIFDTFARIRVGIDRIQCKNTVITHVFYKTDHPEHTKTHVFYKTDRQEIAQDSPGEPREPRQPREPSSAQESPESPNCMVFLKCSESL